MAPRKITRRGLDWISSAPVTVTASAVLDASPEAIWSVLEDHAAWPEWMDTLDKVVPGDTSTGVGGTRSVHIGPMQFDEEFLAWEPGSRFSFVVLAMTIPAFKTLVEDLTMEPTSDGKTQFTYTQAIEPSFVLKPFAGRVKKQLQAGIEAALPKLEGAGQGNVGLRPFDTNSGLCDVAEGCGSTRSGRLSR